jgi:zona occludens toxin (predicted ATPase)
MIYLYTGTPGSGKSLHAAQDILMASFKGKQVIANFAVRATAKQKRQGKAPIYWDNTEITPKKLIQYAKANHKKGLEDQTLLVIDECQIMFNCRAFNAKGREEWIKFFSLHRHFGYKIILITQYDRSIDRQIRVMAEYEVKHRCANNFKLIGLIMTLFRVRVFIAIEKWYGINEINSREMFFFRKRYANVYDSYANFKDMDDDDAPAVTRGGAGGSLPAAPCGAAPVPVFENYVPAEPLTEDKEQCDYETTAWGVKVKAVTEVQSA